MATELGKTGKKLSVVLIEDDEDDYLITRDLLDEISTGGFDLKWIADYDEAVRFLSSTEADVYLVDYRLGNRSGIDLLSEAMGNGVRAPIILLTGQGNRDVDLEAMHKGAADYLIKGEINSFLLDRAIRHAIERRQIAEALLTSEERFRSLIESSSDGIALIDEDATISYASPGLIRILGYDEQGLVGKDFLSLVDAECLSAIRSVLAEMRSNVGTTEHQDSLLERQDGTWCWVELALTNLVGQSSVGAIVVNVRDVTERKQHERELAAVARIGVAMRVPQTREEVVERGLEEIESILECSGTLLSTVDPMTNELRVEGARGSWTSREGSDWQPIPEIGHRAVRTGQPSLRTSVEGATTAHRACVPLVTKDLTMGVIWLERKHPLSDSEIQLFSALADILASTFFRVTLHEQSEERISNLRALRTIDVAISSSMDLTLTLSVVVEQVLSQLKVDAADVLLFNSKTSRLRYCVGRGFRSRDMETLEIGLSEEIAGEAMARRGEIVTGILSPGPGRRRSSFLVSEGFSHFGATALVAKGQVVGLLEVFSKNTPSLAAEWLSFFETLAGQAAIAVENIQLFTDIQNKNLELTLAYDTTIEGWSRALDLRDHETEGHSLRVTDMTVELALAYGVHEDDIVHIRRGALLHDMGKLGVPDSILLKPGPLSEDEWAIMRRHPSHAYEMLYPIVYLRPALDIPYCHHEKWDGSGYPRGLEGERIPLAARLFAVVDVWDALRSDRPYRKAWPVEKVVDHVRGLAGSHFDPQVVAVFLGIVGG